jgi:hypothetical protein
MGLVAMMSWFTSPRAMTRVVFWPGILVALLVSTSAADRAVTVVGSSKGKELDVIATAAREATEQASWTAVPQKLPPERVADVIRCSLDRDSRCIGQLLDDVGADRLIALRMADEKYHDQPVRVVYGMILRRGGDVLASSQRHCEGCRDDLLADHVRSLVTELVRDARSKVNPAVLVVRSVPRPARVKIDGEAVGPTDLEIPIAAGIHSVEIALKDYQTHTQEITIRDGQRLPIEVKLVPINGAQPDGDRHDSSSHRPKQHRRVPWIVVAGGAALAISGGLLVATDEDAVQDGAVVPSYRDTATAGAILAATGAATAAVGIVWLVRSRSTKPANAPTITPMVTYQDGAHIGISGRF